jgi:hypothetical protein
VCVCVCENGERENKMLKERWSEKNIYIYIYVYIYIYIERERYADF